MDKLDSGYFKLNFVFSSWKRKKEKRIEGREEERRRKRISISSWSFKLKLFEFFQVEIPVKLLGCDELGKLIGQRKALTVSWRWLVTSSHWQKTFYTPNRFAESTRLSHVRRVMSRDLRYTICVVLVPVTAMTVSLTYLLSETRYSKSWSMKLSMILTVCSTSFLDLCNLSGPVKNVRSFKLKSSWNYHIHS